MSGKANKILIYNVEQLHNGMRLDIFLSELIPEESRSSIQRLIKDGMVTVDHRETKPNYKIKTGQNIRVSIPPPTKAAIVPENMDLDIIYQDSDIAVINKPQGMVVHPAPGNYSGTLVNALLYHCDRLSSINGKIRPGIVHRLDKDTSGLILVAKNDYAHRHLAAQIAGRTALRVYSAIVENNFADEEGTIDAPIKRHPVERKKMTVMPGPGSREAITHFRVMERFGEFTLIEASLETGRTHQIRVHMSHIRHPIVGDPLYGSKKQRFNLPGQALHAKMLGIIHPTTGKFMEFIASPPEYFVELVARLRSI